MKETLPKNNNEGVSIEYALDNLEGTYDAAEASLDAADLSSLPSERFQEAGERIATLLESLRIATGNAVGAAAVELIPRTYDARDLRVAVSQDLGAAIAV